jgi:hypothetical protein
MPKIQWTDLPPSLREHLFDRLVERQITAEDLYKLKLWRESEPEAPDGPWFKDFGSATSEGVPPGRCSAAMKVLVRWAISIERAISPSWLTYRAARLPDSQIHATSRALGFSWRSSRVSARPAADDAYLAPGSARRSTRSFSTRVRRGLIQHYSAGFQHARHAQAIFRTKES